MHPRADGDDRRASPIGSMGNDTPLAVLSDMNPLLFSYFRQLFAQVSNPPLDAMREELVTSLETFIGSEQNLFEETPEHCHQLMLKEPFLTNRELAQDPRAQRRQPALAHPLDPVRCRRSAEGAMHSGGRPPLRRGLAGGRGRRPDAHPLRPRRRRASTRPSPACSRSAAVHHHLIREGTRTKVGLVVEIGGAARGAPLRRC